jgi:hypothetical protein
MVQTMQQGKPWYRFPLVWMMVAIPLAAVVMGVVMIYLAVTTYDGLVVDDYYKQGLEINQVLDRQRHALELGLQATLQLGDANRVVNIRFNKGGLADYPETLTLSLQHATRQDSDVQVSLNHGLDDQYIGQLPFSLMPGIWYFTIASEQWKISAREKIKTGSTIKLDSGI